jgi:hypothetical protein
MNAEKNPLLITLSETHAAQHHPEGWQLLNTTTGVMSEHIYPRMSDVALAAEEAEEA